MIEISYVFNVNIVETENYLWSRLWGKHKLYSTSNEYR